MNCGIIRTDKVKIMCYSCVVWCITKLYSIRLYGYIQKQVGRFEGCVDKYKIIKRDLDVVCVTKIRS